MQPPVGRDAHCAQGSGVGRGEEGTHAGVAARGQGKWGKRWSGTQRRRGKREQRRRKQRRMVTRTVAEET
eukprot:6176291-Pleurochrysis_carterae.AAC.1